MIEALPAPILCCLAVAVAIRPVAIGILLGVIVAAAVGAVSVRRVRRRAMHVTGEGLEVQRDKYGLQASWAAVTGVRQSRLLRLVPVDVLVLAEATPIARTSRGKTTTPPARLAHHPAAKAVQVSFYDKDWCAGVIGDELRRRGIL
jgi:hypothetical protein